MRNLIIQLAKKVKEKDLHMSIDVGRNSLQTYSIKSIHNCNFLLVTNRGQLKLMFCSNHVKYCVYLDLRMVAPNTGYLLKSSFQCFFVTFSVKYKENENKS